MFFVDEFLQYLSFEKRFSHHTVVAYKTDLAQFVAFLGTGITSFSDLNPRYIRNWMIELCDSGNSPRSIRRKMACLNTYFRWAVKNNHTSSNPCQLISLPKTSKKLPEFAEEKKLNIVLDEYPFANNFEGWRNRLIIELFYTTGIRLSELIGLTVGNIDTDEMYIRVLGKRNKERLIPVTRRICDMTATYLPFRDSLNPMCSNLFIKNNGNPMYAKLVYRIVHQFLSEASTLSRRSPHILRHTFATHMLNHGADINAIKELLGHSSLAATQVYTHNSFEKLKKVYQQAHPRA
jgi:integrase/recombinase XerC